MNKDLILRGWDLSEVPNPSYVLHMGMLKDNLQTIDKVRREAGVDIIVALKANATWSVFPLLAKHSDGATASSLAEARLIYEEMGCKAHLYAPVYVEEEFDELLLYCSHVTFNSLSQYQRFREKAKEAGVSCGLRINPEYSTVDTDMYNPSSPQSRLGISAQALTDWPEGVEGLHFHTLCESRPSDLYNTLRAVEEKFGHFFYRLKWINMGGGHLMTHTDYHEDELIEILKEFKNRYSHLQIILEPGSAFTWDTGVLVGRVEDVLCNGGRNIMMLNVSFACHMPDCLEMPYKPVVLGMHDPIGEEVRWYMGGNSCLAGDYVGCWSFDESYWPKVGDKVVFRDMIHYTMVKTTLFNGVSHPSIVLYEPNEGFKVIRRFGYEDYKFRMSDVLK
ncbi:MAG: carboxynorspermidine decarboxylase [Parabacteroides sp.]|nr:carboxynorspermidine decarboxylase [Parabacteroides sp.]